MYGQEEVLVKRCKGAHLSTCTRANFLSFITSSCALFSSWRQSVLSSDCMEPV